MDFWPEFLASSWGREFVAGGVGGMAGVVSGYPLDTLRVLQQSSPSGSAFSILRNVVCAEGPIALYRGMAAPMAAVTFQGSQNQANEAQQDAYWQPYEEFYTTPRQPPPPPP